MTADAIERPWLGHGVGLRLPHYDRALAGDVGRDVDWVEVISENFFGPGGGVPGGRPRAVLERVRSEIPVVLHGVSLGPGSALPPDPGYLATMAALCAWIEPAWVSEHLCWASSGGHHAHELLPLPYTEEALATAVRHIGMVQDALGRQILIENVSSYVTFSASAMPEWEFVSEVARRADCFVLLDLNNIVVSAENHGFSADAYLEGIDPARVRQFHLANHSDAGTHRFDDHRGPVPEVVWSLYEDALRRLGPVSSLVEWDEDVPAWETLLAQRDQARARDRGARRGRATMRLPELQALFWAAIRHPRGVEAFLADADAGTGEAFAAAFVQTPKFSRVQRIGVYAESYFWRLAEVLGQQYRVVAWLAGPVRFHNLVTDFVWAHPSTSRDVRRVGAGFVAYVAAHPIAREIAGIEELAAVERAIVEALDATDVAPLGSEALAARPIAQWPALRLHAAPWVRLLSCRRSYPALFAARAREEPSPDPVPAPDGAVHRVLVWREGLEVLHRSVAPPEARALTVLLAGGTFERICSAAADPDAGDAAGPEAVVQWLSAWLAAELIVGMQ